MTCATRRGRHTTRQIRPESIRANFRFCDYVDLRAKSCELDLHVSLFDLGFQCGGVFLRIHPSQAGFATGSAIRAVRGFGLAVLVEFTRRHLRCDSRLRRRPPHPRKGKPVARPGRKAWGRRTHLRRPPRLPKGLRLFSAALALRTIVASLRSWKMREELLNAVGACRRHRVLPSVDDDAPSFATS